MPQTDVSTERYNNEGPECPHCGEVMYAGDLSDKDSGEIDCGACGKLFCYEVAVEYSYTTYVKRATL